MVKIGKKAPKWKATVYNNGEKGTLSSEELKGSWYVIYWWPFNFTGICNSEVVGFKAIEAEFAEAGIQLIGASCDSFHSHKNWFANASAFPDGAPAHPVIADNTHNVTKDFGFYLKDIGSACRANVLVDPDGIVRSAGANFLNIARDPNDVLVTAKAFVRGGGCAVPDRAGV